MDFRQIPLYGWSKEKRWVPRKKEYRRERIIVDYAQVSLYDFAELSKRTWYKNGNGYAQSDYPTRVLMHTLLTSYKMTDHKDRDKLNNTRDNLRECTPQENIANSGSKNGKLYKGVSYCKQTSRYKATKMVAGKNKTIGRFKTAEQAAHAFNLFALSLPTAEYEYLNEVSIYEAVS